MATRTPTTPTFGATPLISEVLVAASAGTRGTKATLDLRTADGAWIYAFIGRLANTTPSRSSYIACRPTFNNGLVVPTQKWDVVNQGPTTACAATAVAAGGAAASQNLVDVTSTTGFAVGDTIFLGDSGNLRCQWNRVFAVVSATRLSLEFNLRTALLQNDVVSNLADVRHFPIPGGDIYEFQAFNNSASATLSQAFRLEYALLPGDTIT